MFAKLLHSYLVIVFYITYKIMQTVSVYFVLDYIIYSDNIKVLCNKTFMYTGNTCYNMFIMPIVFEHLFYIFSVCILQFILI